MSIIQELEKNTELLIKLEGLFDELIEKLEPILKADDCKSESSFEECSDSDQSKVSRMVSIRNGKLEILNHKLSAAIRDIDL